jgi:hypothetical protein
MGWIEESGPIGLWEPGKIAASCSFVSRVVSNTRSIDESMDRDDNQDSPKEDSNPKRKSNIDWEFHNKSWSLTKTSLGKSRNK